ncbi:tyrosine-type recombinase/integrase [Oceanobacillus sp. J11TS1]|uniref:tyrosine-type recombinase/integrase n=1 Tax=Oceanobacillus sp. J11TS1 TaxID=2807191 RepID=UPI001B12D9AD|nr:tyrosine-type recombinase/integrase [Oceanobacillus sp. J11TS1]GIO22495.1 tyrosine recombinase XerC [Oceanobacillus sp. J11TS1]
MPRPQDRKTKSYKKIKRTYSIDDARNFVIKIKELEGLSKNTIHGYEKFWNDMDRFFDEKMNVADLTADDARDFMHWQLYEKTPFLKSIRYDPTKKGISPVSANTYLTYGKTSFKILEQEGITTNIFSSIPKIKERQKKVDTLTVNELNKLFKSMDKGIYTEFRDYVACFVMLDSFGRVDEVLSVKKTDIDFQHKSITFQRTKNRRVRTIPLTNQSMKLIEELLDETEDFESEYLFLSVFGTRLRPDTFRKHLREIVERSGIKKRVHPHLFRHTASKMFLEQNGSIRVLQQILDHADSSTTARYAHVLDDTVKAQHKQFTPINMLKKKAKTRTKRGESRK